MCPAGCLNPWILDACRPAYRLCVDCMLVSTPSAPYQHGVPLTKAYQCFGVFLVAAEHIRAIRVRHQFCSWIALAGNARTHCQAVSCCAVCSCLDVYCVSPTLLPAPRRTCLCTHSVQAALQCLIYQPLCCERLCTHKGQVMRAWCAIVALPSVLVILIWTVSSSMTFVGWCLTKSPRLQGTRQLQSTTLTVLSCC